MASPHRTSTVVRPRRGPVRWSTTGGVGTAGRPIQRRAWRPLRAVRCYLLRWARRPTTLYLTPLHGKANVLKALIANIRAALRHVKDTAEQFKAVDRWAVLLRYVSDKIAPVLNPFRPPGVLQATG